jgi:hypothetical protein
MSEYTSTREGFETSMKVSLTGPPEEAKAYVEATSVPTFYHIMNGKRLEYPEEVKLIEEWRAKSSEWKPVMWVLSLFVLVRLGYIWACMS